jgi:uncharacterized glyoxalase superfamily protein PhnB
MSPRLPTPVPEIPVSDVAAASSYYARTMGFNLDWGGTEGDLAGISREDCRLFLAGPTFRRDRGNAIPMLTWLNLSSKAEVDELHRAWSASGAILQSAPEDKPWGLREFTAADPDGNLFRVFYDFATPERERTARVNE